MKIYADYKENLPVLTVILRDLCITPFYFALCDFPHIILFFSCVIIPTLSYNRYFSNKENHMKMKKISWAISTALLQQD